MVRGAPAESQGAPRRAKRRTTQGYPGPCREKRLGYASIVERLTDRLGRPVRDLRISVTDRCNFRCVYCMPKEVFGRDYAFLARTDLLTFEEIERLARAFAGAGRREDQDHGRRAARPPRPGDAWSRCWPRSTGST